MSGRGRKRLDLTNQRFERLIAKDYFIKTYENGVRKTIWNCVCDCGNTSQVSTGDLKNGHSKSCGCLKDETTSKRNFKHGYAKIKPVEYVSWQAAKSRCFNTNFPQYDDYGGRGISMSLSWKDDFERFLSDMGQCPEGFTLERLDVNQGYSPENCIWADYYTQAQNRRMNSLNTSGKTGVSWDNRLSKYRVYIGLKGKFVHLIVTEDFELACFVRKEAELTYYGKYSNS